MNTRAASPVSVIPSCVQHTLRAPPGSSTRTSWPMGTRPVRTAAATAAQAPLPQAMVSPLPRSHTRMRRLSGPVC